LQRLRIPESGGSVDRRHVVALQLRADHLQLARRDGLDPRREVRDRDLVLDGVIAAVEGALAEAGKIEDGLAKSLRRDRAGMETDASDPLLAIHDGDRVSRLRRRDGSLLAGGPRPDHDEVVGMFLHPRRLSTGWKFRLKTGWRRREPPYRTRTSERTISSRIRSPIATSSRISRRSRATPSTSSRASWML